MPCLNRYDHPPLCVSGPTPRRSELRRASTPCGALAAVPPSPSFPRLQKGIPSDSTSDGASDPSREGFCRSGTSFGVLAQPSSGCRSVNGSATLAPILVPCLSRFGTSTCVSLPVGDFDSHQHLAVPLLIAQPPPSLRRLRVVTSGSPSVARPFFGRQGRDGGERLPASSLRTACVVPRVPRLLRVATPFGFDSGRLSPFSKGWLRSAGPPCGVPPSRATGGAVIPCSKSSSSPTGASWASGLFVFLSALILRFDQHVRQSGKKGRRGIKDLDPDEAWSDLTPRKTVPVTGPATPASQPG